MICSTRNFHTNYDDNSDDDSNDENDDDDVAFEILDVAHFSILFKVQRSGLRTQEVVRRQLFFHSRSILKIHIKADRDICILKNEWLKCTSFEIFFF